MAQPGNAAAAAAARVSHTQQQQQQGNDLRDRRAQSLEEAQRKRGRGSGCDFDSTSESRSAKLAKIGACCAPANHQTSSSTHPCASSPCFPCSPNSPFPSSSSSSSSSSSRTTEIFGTPTGRVEDYFALESAVLGSGQFGTVRRCVEKATGTRFACKTILKSRLTTESESHDVRREVVLMQRLAAGASCGATSGPAGTASAAGASGFGGYNPQHVGTGVVQLRAVFEDERAVHLVMELCDGGELFDEIVRRGRLSERDAAQVFRQIVSAVALCHSRGVLHRDLKPENILLSRVPAFAASAPPATPATSPAGSAAAATPSAATPAAAGAGQRVVAKLADFGLAIPLKHGERARGVAGSPFYIAPEVLTGDYSLEADVWSLGVILYILLSGAPPFWGATDRDVFIKVLRNAVDMSGEEWRGVSEEAKGLVRCLLQRDPKRRPAAGKILTHPWILLNCLGGRIVRQQLGKKLVLSTGAAAGAAVAGAGASAAASSPVASSAAAAAAASAAAAAVPSIKVVRQQPVLAEALAATAISPSGIRV
ncbi:hypothetical protein CLOM_g448 [Closterium sp. NIES-68]|nr:hypothetical protein CLOM_g448 [Closterium sp. NIES-68]GJP81347.1 hypothetical protein CLOP_g11510 [Closterium sp. NIES-67]